MDGCKVCAEQKKEIAKLRLRVEILQEAIMELVLSSITSDEEYQVIVAFPELYKAEAVVKLMWADDKKTEDGEELNKG